MRPSLIVSTATRDALHYIARRGVDPLGQLASIPGVSFALWFLQACGERVTFGDGAKLELTDGASNKTDA